MDLRMAQGKLDSAPAEAAELIDAALEDLRRATAELRELARGIHPAAHRGRSTARAHCAPGALNRSRGPGGRSAGAIPCGGRGHGVLRRRGGHDQRRPLRRRRQAEVEIVHADGLLSVEVRDDGRGGAEPARGSGLRGLGDQVAALDLARGHRPPGGGTVLRAEIPCES